MLRDKLQGVVVYIDVIVRMIIFHLCPILSGHFNDKIIAQVTMKKV